jgi:hypothetical protein
MNQPMKTCYFIVKRTVLVKLLKKLDTYVVNKKYRYRCICELTLIDGAVSFNVPGCTFGLEVVTEGTAKATFELKIFRDIIKTFNEKELKIEINKGSVLVNNFSFSADTSFFEDDNVLRSFVLPINYSEMDLISISASNKYTTEELHFNRLFVLVTQAERRLNNNINSAARSLGHYGITKKDIEVFLKERIQLHIKAMEISLNSQKKIQRNSSR